MEIKYRIEGLDCANCAAGLERELRKIPGVRSLEIDFMAQLIRAELDENRRDAVTEMMGKVTGIMHPECTLSEIAEQPPTEDGTRVYRRYEPRLQSVQRIGFLHSGWIVPAAATLLLAIMTVIDLSADLPGWLRALLFAVPLLTAGFSVYRTALRNVLHGRLFDEKFLMAIASVGGFILGEYLEACAVLILFQVGELFQDYAVRRSRRSVEQILALRPEYANVRMEGEWTRVMPDSVLPGDLILVKPGERVPLDGIVEEGESDADTANLTGESMPRPIGPGDAVMSGTVNLTGALLLRVTAAYRDSTINRMLELVQNATARKAKAEQFITRFARVYTPLVVGLAALLFLLPWCITGEWSVWLYRALSFLVISCPCALVISVPLTYFGAIGAASRRGILIKGSVFLDRFNKIGAMVFDKTGTLTKGALEVCRIESTNAEECLRVAAHAEFYSDHPVARAVQAAYRGKIDGESVSGLEELAGCGVICTLEGCVVLCGNAKLMERYDVEIPQSGGESCIYVAKNLEYLGCIVFRDAVRADSAGCIRTLRNLGIQTVMLSGDRREIAAELGKRLGMDESLGELLPEQKLEELKRIRAQLPDGRLIAYVGDGINDAPALTGADVGIAMGGIGSAAAVECADVVVTDEKLSALPECLRIGRKSRRIVLENIVFALSVKAAVLILAAIGLAPMWAAIFADVGVAVLAILNSVRMLADGKRGKAKNQHAISVEAGK